MSGDQTNEANPDDEQTHAGPQVGVDATGLVGLGVAEQAHRQQDHAVHRQQPPDDVADVQGTGLVPAVGSADRLARTVRQLAHHSLLRRAR